MHDLQESLNKRYELKEVEKAYVRKQEAASPAAKSPLSNGDTKPKSGL